MNDLGIRSGDILLYAGNTIEDKFIQLVTKGRYTHCSIAISETSMIEAISKYGVVRNPIYKPDSIIPMKTSISSERVDSGIAFLQRRLGSKYSLLDVAIDGYLTLLPKRLSNTPILIAPSRFDCSHLAVLFLIITGVVVPDKWILEPNSISPMDIYRWSITNG